MDYFAKQIAQKLGLREYYAYESQAKLFVEKLDFDMTALAEFMADNTFSSVDGTYL